MSASASFPILDAIRTGNVARGYCSYAFIQAVHKLGLHQRATDSGSPADVSCSESPYRKYCCRIEPRGIYTGFLLMVIGYFTDRPASAARGGAGGPVPAGEGPDTSVDAGIVSDRRLGGVGQKTGYTVKQTGIWRAVPASNSCRADCDGHVAP